MTPAPVNPYAKESDSYKVWEMCVRRDLEGFLAADWSICAEDFMSEGFIGWDARHSADPMEWVATYSNLETYKTAWLIGAQDFQKNNLPADIRDQLYAIVSLVRIELNDNTGIVHKKFKGQVKFQNHSVQSLNWQSIFHLRKIDGRWLQSGFIGYLPLNLGSPTSKN
jgi:hypothetical protein